MSTPGRRNTPSSHHDGSTRGPGWNVRRLRLEQGLTAEQLAYRAGVAVRTITRLESGATPTVTTMLAVAAVLDVPVDQLLRTVPRADGDPADPVPAGDAGSPP